jgi:hypothetical protein
MGKSGSALGIHLFHNSHYFERIASDSKPGSSLYVLLHNADINVTPAATTRRLRCRLGSAHATLLSRVEAVYDAFLL